MEPEKLTVEQLHKSGANCPMPVMQREDIKGMSKGTVLNLACIIVGPVVLTNHHRAKIWPNECER